MKKPTIFTIGGATFDIFVQAEEQSIMTVATVNSKHKWLSFPYGEKVTVKEVLETFGGGATNAAITFAKMGFEAFFVGKVGDQYSQRVFDNLKQSGVRTDYVKKTRQDKTGFSTIINTFDGDRTLLYYPGANRFFTEKDLPMEALKGADWIFLSHLAQSHSRIPAKLLSLFQTHPRIKLAWNPGKEQIEEGMTKWKGLLKNTEVLFLNKEEASRFTRTPYKLAGVKQDKPEDHDHSFLPPYADDVMEIVQKLLAMGVKKVVVTDGRNGAQASDGKDYLFCPVVTRKRVDTLGAGDAFASGLTSALMKGLPLKTALVYGTLNASSVVSFPGAQKGILDATEMEKRLKASSLKPKSIKL